MVVLIIVVTSVPVYGRIVRTQTLSLKATEFILAERSLGAGPIRILGVHVLPNVIGPLLILASMDVPVVVTIEAGLSFLGLGVPQSTPSWGGMLSDAIRIFEVAWWLMLFPGLFLVITTLSFNLLGDGLRDALDPRSNR
jgi:peptide/nickel transport system permease protein